ncbi:MAG: undecaprenyl-phosphate galactose phosphotransferase WbaP, partial [Selenomonadaceae bacterium]|nr:undecaprenyl-phosphate galactose phosphotransferase WbaP [Selenomonadaceae bacterium]
SDVLLPALLMLLDYAMIVSAEMLAYGLRRFWLPNANPDFYIPAVYLYIIVPTIFLCFLKSTDAHMRSIPFWRMAQNVFWAVFYSILTITMLMYFGKVGEVVSRLFVGMTGCFSFLFILVARYFFKQYINRQKLFQVPVLFIGAGRTAKLLLDAFDNDTGFGYRVIGFIEDRPEKSPIADRVRILGRFSNIERVIQMTGVQNVIITVPGLSASEQVAMVNRIQPLVKNVSFVPDLIGTPVGALDIETLVDSKLMLLRVRNNLARWYNRLAKRVFDILVSFCGMVFVLPLGLFLAIAIYIDSPGPIVFAHRRIGQHGKEFPCYKFRSMVPDADTALKKYLEEHPEAREEWERDFKLKDDPRVTRVGRILRKTSLDELPQLLNVLKGEMSLVGPRPIVQAEIVKYGDLFHDFCLVPPGITGMWQVNGRSDTTYEERVQMDSWYVRNWSVWIDIVYLLKTFKVVFSGKGAY